MIWWSAPAASPARTDSPRWASASSSSPAFRSARRARPTCCGLRSWVRKRRGSPDDVTRLSDVAAVDLFGQLLDQVRNALEAWLEGERAAEHFERVLVVAEFLKNDAEPRERAEVARLARQHFVDIGERVAEILLGVIHGGAAVPGLDEIRPDVDDGVE